MNDYPFELWVYSVVVYNGKDDNGFEIEPVSEWVKHSDCYEEVMIKENYFKKENGDSFSYSSKIFLPADVSQIADGTKVQVWQNGNVRFEGVSKRFSRDLEHCRLWV